METILAIIYEPRKAKSFVGYVARLAQDLHRKVRLMYIQEPYDYTLVQPPARSYEFSLQTQKKNAEEGKKLIADYVRDFARESSIEVVFEYSAEIGFPASLIDDFINKNRTGMVILEGQEHKSLWLGPISNSDIVRQVNCPVWIIPFEAPYTGFKEIVYATDYKEEDVPALKNLISITSVFSPSVTALHITENEDFEERIKEVGFAETLQEKTGYKKLTVRTILEKKHENVAELINDFAIEIKADLITVFRENRNFFERVLKADSTRQIIKETQLPLLIFKQ
jgi:nucleotide-binding universal stress UspA family protein